MKQVVSALIHKYAKIVRTAGIQNIQAYKVNLVNDELCGGKTSSSEVLVIKLSSLWHKVNIIRFHNFS